MKPYWNILRFAAPVLFAAVAVADDVPGWRFSGVKTFSIGLDREIRHGGQASAFISCITECSPGGGTLMQSIRAEDCADKRLRFAAWVKAENAAVANLWMRIDGEASEVLNFDNGDKHPFRGTFDWTRQNVVLDVPHLAATIHIGLLLQGKAKAWIDDATVQIVDHKVKTTNWLVRPLPPNPNRAAPQRNRAPLNLDFETWP